MITFQQIQKKHSINGNPFAINSLSLKNWRSTHYFLFALQICCLPVSPGSEFCGANPKNCST